MKEVVSMAKKDNPSSHSYSHKTITKEELAKLPLVQYSGNIQLVRTQKELRQAVKDLKKETLLGFDTESKPSFQKGTTNTIAVVQLAAENSVYIFQLKLLQDITPLHAIWNNAKILKVGIALTDDIKKLKELGDFESKGFLDISSITKKIGISNTGLRALVGIFLKRRISKSAQVTNWAKPELTPAQIAYAATDAWISRELYQHIIQSPSYLELQNTSK
jgi:ribonuclease D